MTYQIKQIKEFMMHDKEQIFKNAVSLLKKDKFIIHTNLLYPRLGVSETWWYENIASNKEKSETIKGLMSKNAACNTTKSLKKLEKQKDTAGITSFLKINSKLCRQALSTTREEVVNVPYNDIEEKEDLLKRLDELGE